MRHERAYFPDLVSRQEVIADVQCRRCGYNVRGLRIYGRCPECGEDVYRSVEATRSRSRCGPRLPRWSALLCISLTTGCVLPLLGFYALLWGTGWATASLRPQSRPAMPVPAYVHSLADALSLFVFFFGICVCGCCILIAGIAAVRRDFRVGLLSTACAAIAGLCSLLAMKLGFALIGM
jgi:hypothetical protein